MYFITAVWIRHIFQLIKMFINVILSMNRRENDHPNASRHQETSLKVSGGYVYFPIFGQVLPHCCTTPYNLVHDGEPPCILYAATEISVFSSQRITFSKIRDWHTGTQPRTLLRKDRIDCPSELHCFRANFFTNVLRVRRSAFAHPRRLPCSGEAWP